MANKIPDASARDTSKRARRSVGRPPKDTSSAGEVPRRIKQAATELFAEKGFHGTGVNEIGDRADLRRGSLYYHIGSKEALLWQIFADHLSASLASVTQIAQSSAPPTERLRALIHHQVEFVIERQLEMVIYHRDRDALQGERAVALQENVDAIAAQWRKVLHEGYGRGEFTTDDPVVLNGILSMVNMAHQWFLEDGPDSPHEVADKLATFAFGGLGVSP
jgi:TetR/AcrR family transcriptional regulator, cholesterol catabolism regulator